MRLLLLLALFSSAIFAQPQAGQTPSRTSAGHPGVEDRSGIDVFASPSR